MKIAVTYENGNVFQHFGHTENFAVYEISDGKISNSEIIPTDGEGHGALADFLKAKGMQVLICGGIGQGARDALGSAGIEIYGGVTGPCDEAVHAFLNGNLSYNPDAKCDHHDSGEGHGCGGHHHCH